MTVTLSLLLVVVAILLTIAHAMKRVPLWPAVLLLGLAMLA